MIVAAEVTIAGARSEIWAVMTDIEHAAGTMTGIEKIEILERPPHGLVGLKWRETRMLFGKPAAADKWITEAVDQESYSTRAESDGFVFTSTTGMTGPDGSITLTTTHVSEPQTLVARVQSIMMGLLFKGVARKALLQDLNDIKAAVARNRSRPG